jgi:[NiFe] hydrogenase diaphorase moiety large subunit
MIKSNYTGKLTFSAVSSNQGLKAALAKSPAELIDEITASQLKGRGGAGFPTGMKWKFAAGSDVKQKYVICNADEGEPGTFKDRVILTDHADLVFEGMTIGGYAIGSSIGIIYLRGEYTYMRQYLEKILQDRRKNNLLG